MVDKRGNLKDNFKTYGRIYQFPFAGGRHREHSGKFMKSLINKRNIE